jgi:hypothetical protein
LLCGRNGGSPRLQLTLSDLPKASQTLYVVSKSLFGPALTEVTQLLKAVNRLPGLSDADIDRDAILLRAYGKGTDVLIDRESMRRLTPSLPVLSSANYDPSRGVFFALPTRTARSRSLTLRSLRQRPSLQIYFGHCLPTRRFAAARGMARGGTEAGGMACNITYIEYQQHMSYIVTKRFCNPTCFCRGHGGADARHAHP